VATTLLADIGLLALEVADHAEPSVSRTGASPSE
jgi:hypothetical protein